MRTILNYNSRFWGKVGEQVISLWNIIPAPGLIRSAYRRFQTSFWRGYHDPYSNTRVNYQTTRSLYRNDGEHSYGAGFAKPIVDLQVAFIGLPRASSDDENRDAFLNECTKVYWASELQQIMRDAMRDSKTIVRITKPDVFDPLMTLEEADHCQLEILSPERVEIEYNPRNKNIIDRAIVTHRMIVVENDGNVAEGRDPEVREIEVLEIVTPERFRFFNKTDNVEMDSLSSRNRWGFVNFLEIYNEYDAALADGQSEYENVMPFIIAFHDVMEQGLKAHAYHSTPKLKFNLNDVGTFIKNNFPDAWDETTGRVMPGTSIPWRGTEILFFESEEDAGFIEAESILGDTKTLLEFLIDCICIASETPEWAFMRVDSGSANSDRNAQTVPLVKKISRKRTNFAPYIQRLWKMALVINGRIPYRVGVEWDVIRADDQVVTMQAFQQMMMGLEVAHQAGQISDTTYREMIAMFVPAMKTPSQEGREAERDLDKRMDRDMEIQQGSSQLAITGGPQGQNE